MGKGEVPIWHGLTREQMITQYKTFGMTKEVEDAHIMKYVNDSAMWRRRHGEPTILHYGSSEAETIRFHRSSLPGLRPLVLNLKGGYWRIPGAEWVDFVGAGMNPRGVHVANIDYGVMAQYDNMPRYSMEEVVEQVGNGIMWMLDHAAEFDIDLGNVHLVGHSAGGHLAAVMAGLNLLPPHALKSISCVSGLYDLGFALKGHLSEDPGNIHLSKDHAQRYSPINMQPQTNAVISLYVGEKETSEFHRQAADLQIRWPKSKVITATGKNHYTLYGGLGSRSSGLSRQILTQVGRNLR